MPRWLPILLLLLLPLLLLGDALWPGHVLADAGTEQRLPWSATAQPEELDLPQVNADTIRENLVYRIHLTDHVRQGELPVWSSALYGGLPYLALNHTQVLYPPALAASWLDPFFAYGLLIALHLVLAGLGMYAFLRAQRLSVEAALVGALIFQLNGMFATRHGHPQFVATAAWLPLLGLGVEWLTRTRWAAGMLLLAGSTAMMVLAGHPSIYVYGTYFVGAWLLLRLLGVDPPPDWRTRLVVAGAFAGAFALGLGLASGQLLATLELAGFSAREERSVVGMVRRLSHWAHLVRIFFPNVTGTPIDGSYFSVSFTHYTAGTLYLGVPSLLLAGLGAVRGGRRGAALAVLAIASLLLMYWPPVYRLAYHLLPGFKFSRADRFSIVWYLTLANLAAVGVDGLRAASRVRPWKEALRPLLLWAGPVLVVAAVAVARIPGVAAGRLILEPEPGAPDHLLSSVAWGLLLAAAAAAWWAAVRRFGARDVLLHALVLLVVVDLGSFFRHHVVVRDATRIFRQTPALTFLQEADGPFRIAKVGGRLGKDLWTVLPANTPAVFGLEDLHGFGPLHVHHVDRLLSGLERGIGSNAWHLRPLLDPASALAPTLDVANVRYILSDGGIEGLPVAFDGPLTILENPDALPRVSFAPRGVLRKDSLAAQDLATGAVDPREVVQLASAPSTVPTAEGEATVALLDRGPGWYEVSKTGPGGGFLRLSEAWYPGWTAVVDGVEQPTLRADVMFQAIPIGPGDHQVRFVYRPTWLPLARGITGLSLLGLLGLGVAAVRRRR